MWHTAIRMSSGAVCSCWRTTTHIPKGITLSFITEASNTWVRAIQTRNSVGSGVAYLVHYGTRSHQMKARAFVTHCDCTWVPSAHPTLTSGARSVGGHALPVSSFNSWALYTRTWIWQLSNQNQLLLIDAIRLNYEQFLFAGLKTTTNESCVAQKYIYYLQIDTILRWELDTCQQ